MPAHADDKRADGPVLNEVAQALSTIEALADESPTPAAFYPDALTVAAGTLGAVRAEAWSGLGVSRPASVWRVTQGEARDPGPTPESVAEWANEANEGLLLQSSPRAAGDVLMAPVVVDDRLIRAVSFGFDGAVPSEAQPGLRRFAMRFGEAAAKVEARAVVAASSTIETRWRRYAEVAAAASSDAPFKSVARELVETGASYLSCGRVALTRASGRGQRAVAVSGIERYAKRADAVVLLERLASVVAKGRQPLYSRSGAGLPPNLEQALEAYLDVSGAKSVAVTPVVALAGRRRVLGAVVFERFDGPPLEDTSDEIHRFLALVESVYDRAARLGSAPLLDGLLRTAYAAGWFGLGWTTKWLAGFGLLAAVAASLVFVRSELTVEAHGELEPSTLRHVFAPADGTVEQVHVRHGLEVQEGSPFVSIVSPDLSLAREEALGELTVVEEELANLKTAGFGVASGPDALQKRREISAQQQLLELRRENLRKQLGLIQYQVDELRVVAPAGGEVVTWDIAKELSSRPVRRGDLLGSVADLSSDWVLKLRVPDRLIGHVRPAGEGDLKLSYLVASDPESTYEATVVRMSPASQVDPVTGDTYVLCEAEMSGESEPTRRFGAAVKARIRCGKQPLYFVWFHEAYEEIRRYFF